MASQIIAICIAKATPTKDDFHYYMLGLKQCTRYAPQIIIESGVKFEGFLEMNRELYSFVKDFPELVEKHDRETKIRLVNAIFEDEEIKSNLMIK